MTQNKDLEKMMKAGKVLDTATNIVGRIIQVVCGVSAVLVLAFFFFMADVDGASMDLTFFGRHVEFENLSFGMQAAVVILMAVIFVLAVIMMGDLIKALRSVFRSMAAGRPFEEPAVKGFRRAALWLVIIGVLANEISAVLIAACFLLFSYVFSYGMMLQIESDETL